MSDEARGTGSLDPARDWAPQQRSRGGRRSSYGQARPDGAQSASVQSGPVYAALDLGTNNCRLLVARPTGESFRVIDAFSRIIRLGEGISATGRICDPAIGRAVDALGICRDKMRNRGVTRARLIATEACRAAANGNEFRTRIAEEVGLELEIIDRETEATLAATGCTPLVDPQAEGVILFDIGGGSSEIVRLGRCAAHAARSAAAANSGLGFAAGRRGDAGGTLRRARGDAGNLRGDDRRGEGVRRPLRRRAGQRQDRPHPHARHLRHRDDDRGGLSRAQALRAPPRRRLLDGQRAGHAGGRSAADDELRGARRQSLHRRGARRPRAGGLRDPRRHPPRVPVPAAARRRSRPARGHAGADDARRRRRGAANDGGAGMP